MSQGMTPVPVEVDAIYEYPLTKLRKNLQRLKVSHQ